MPSSDADEAFAQQLNKLGIATLDEIDLGRQAQRQAEKSGSSISLPDALVEAGVITSGQKDKILKQIQVRKQGSLKKLGQYQLLGKLGEGAMGAVFLAEDTLMQRKVAIKVLPKRFTSDSQFLSRFRREAKAAGNLNHANIVGAYAVGEELGHHFYVMEYCEGVPLDRLLKRENALSWRQALETIIQVAQGLQYAHEHKLLHRDIKPANILITRDGIVKILDLGLSKDVGGDKTSTFETQSGVAVGTPHYISPEQARGDKTLDGRTDIYSLGATFYHLVTGMTPFSGTNAAAIMLKHLNEPIPDPQEILRDLPDGIAQVILKMMAKEPDERYADCGELLEDLGQVKASQGGAIHAAKVATPSVAQTQEEISEPKGSRRTTGLQEPIGERRISRRTSGVRDAVQKRRTTGPHKGIRGRRTTGSRSPVGAREDEYADDHIPPPAPNKLPMYFGMGAVAASLAVVGWFMVFSGKPGEKRTARKSKKATTETTPAELRKPARASKLDTAPAAAGKTIDKPGVPRPDSFPSTSRSALTTPPTITGSAPAPEPSLPSDASARQIAYANQRGLKKELSLDLGGGVKMEFVLIPPGTFMMGERSQQKVTISNGFYLGKYEVTQAQYERAIGVNPTALIIKGAHHPVHYVTWNDCQAFCTKLSRSSGRTVRLPTHTEWEYACRAGTTTRFSFGDSEAKLPDSGWFRKNSDRKPHPVGQKKPNQFGLYDMHGNLWEWCQDSLGNYASRIVRGGDWRSRAHECLSVSMTVKATDRRDFLTGFRTVLDISSAHSAPRAGYTVNRWLLPYLTAFDKAVAEGNFPAAMKTVERAKADPQLGASSREVRDLAAVAGALRAAEIAKLEALRKLTGKPVKLQTRNGFKSGIVTSVQGDVVTLKTGYSIFNGIRRPLQSSIKVSDLTPKASARLLQDVSSTTPAERMARAILMIAAADFEAARRALATAGQHSLTSHYLARIAKIQSGDEPPSSMLKPGAEPFDPTKHKRWAPGVVGTYYRDTEFRQKIMTRVDRQLRFKWDSSPLPNSSDKRFSIQWRGVLRIRKPGMYRFFVDVDSLTRKQNLDGKKFVRTGRLGWKHPGKPRNLAAGDHTIEIDFVNTGGGARYCLYWEGPGIRMEPVPPEHLFHDASKTGVRISLTPGGDVGRTDNPEKKTLQKELALDLGGGVKMEFVLIRPGTFMMGDLASETGKHHEKSKPQHEVTLTKAYYLGKYEVTQAQYERITGVNPSRFKSANKPVELVNWMECVAFCKQLSTKTGWSARLPTEAEWEYACRAGSTTRFCFGDDSADLEEYAWCRKGPLGGTRVVGQKKANAFGLHDMHGNLWEWCQDWFGGYSPGALTDPKGPSTGRDFVIRGGGFAVPPEFCRSAYRHGASPESRHFNYGFRVALELAPGQQPPQFPDVAVRPGVMQPNAGGTTGRTGGRSVDPALKPLMRSLDEAFSRNDLMAAERTIQKAKADPKLKVLAKELGALSGVVAALEKQKKARKEGLEGLVGKTLSLRTKDRVLKGKILGVEGNILQVQRQYVINGQVKGSTSFKVSWLDLTPPCRSRLLPRPKPATPDEWVANAIRLISMKNIDAAAKALAHAPAHPMRAYYERKFPRLSSASQGNRAPQALRELTLDLGGGVRMEFVLVPPGSFMMGNSKGETRVHNILDAHKVTLTRAFFIAKYETTQQQYEKIMNANPSRIKGPSLPIVNVSWLEASSFCDRMGKKVGKSVRLPTEAEREYACRAGTTTQFYFGPDEGALSRAAWFLGNAKGRPQQVGLKKPNAFGLHDMLGNAWEWCADWHAPYPKSEVKDPRGPLTGTHRLLRGGSWVDKWPSLRCAKRAWSPPTTRNHAIGFRVVLNP